MQTGSSGFTPRLPRHVRLNVTNFAILSNRSFMIWNSRTLSSPVPLNSTVPAHCRLWDNRGNRRFPGRQFTHFLSACANPAENSVLRSLFQQPASVRPGMLGNRLLKHKIADSAWCCQILIDPPRGTLSYLPDSMFISTNPPVPQVQAPLQ